MQSWPLKKGKSMKFHVPAMSCGHCTATITKGIASLDPQASVKTDLGTRTVDVTTSQSQAAVIDAIKAAGYDATPA
jgi:copper chaperone